MPASLAGDLDFSPPSGGSQLLLAIGAFEIFIFLVGLKILICGFEPVFHRVPHSQKRPVLRLALRDIPRQHPLKAKHHRDIRQQPDQWHGNQGQGQR